MEHDSFFLTPRWVLVSVNSVTSAINQLPIAFGADSIAFGINAR